FYPLIFASENLLLRCMNGLASNDIHCRRYFYPALSSALPYVNKKHLPLVEEMAKRVLCLPLYHDLSLKEVDHICELLLEAQANIKLAGNLNILTANRQAT